MEINTNESISKVTYGDAEISLVGGTNFLQWKCDNGQSLQYVFYGYNGTNENGEIEALLKDVDTSNVTNMSYMFDNCPNLKQLDVSNINTSNVTNMSYMFSHNDLVNLDLSHFNTSKVTNMSHMFERSELRTLDVSSFDTNNVTDISYMFRENEFKELDLTSFDTSKITNLQNMFSGCSNLEKIIGTIDLIGATNISGMFLNCNFLRTVTVKNIKQNFSIGTSTPYVVLADTLVNVIKELWDYSGGTTTYKLTIGSNNISKIANTYVKLITPTEEMIAEDPNIASKMPCEVCESTDEGAMIISEYAYLKMWSIV